MWQKDKRWCFSWVLQQWLRVCRCNGGTATCTCPLIKCVQVHRLPLPLVTKNSHDVSACPTVCRQAKEKAAVEKGSAELRVERKVQSIQVSFTRVQSEMP